VAIRAERQVQRDHVRFGGALASGNPWPGDVGYIPQGFGHSIENIGAEKARILIVFNSGHYQTIDLSQWIAGNPVDILATNFSVDGSVFEKFPRRDVFLTK
jgi:oxalate decarboxylase